MNITSDKKELRVIGDIFPPYPTPKPKPMSVLVRKKRAIFIGAITGIFTHPLISSLF